MIELKNKRITVMGLGLHGGALGNIEWLVNQGAIVTATDMKTEEQLKKTVEKMREKGLLGENPHPNPLPFQGEGKVSVVKLVLGEHREEDFKNADMVIRNPAVPRNSKYLAIAKAAGVPIEMDSSLFFQMSPSQDIIGVTGSKGKTTTANAIAILLKAQFPQTVAVGIDGVSPLAELPSVQQTSPVVFELSSWRLEALEEKQLSPKIAVVTSLLRDHLNTYDSFEHYIETKKVIVKYQTSEDWAILNYDDERVRAWAPELKSQVLWYSVAGEIPGEGVFVREGKVVVRSGPVRHSTSFRSFSLVQRLAARLQSFRLRHQPEDRAEKTSESAQSVGGEHAEVSIISYDNLPLTGEHERRNLLPGILIAYLKGISPEVIQDELAQVNRLPHRLEEVRVLNGVTYINDSAATMPDATMAALATLGGRSIVHIVGGSDKNLLFEELAQVEKTAQIRALVWLPGTAMERMQEVFKAAGIDFAAYSVASMAEAVQKAQELAQADDVVLLSPGATSFGLFQHEFDRGDQFRAAVRKLT